MILRLKTNIDVESKLTELQSLLQVSSKAAVMRLAIAYSIKMNGDPRVVDGKVVKYNVHQQKGADYNRFTIYGDDELYYRLLMQQKMERHLDDEEFFPELTNAHLERGIKEIYADFKLANNRNKFLKNLLKG